MPSIGRISSMNFNLRRLIFISTIAVIVISNRARCVEIEISPTFSRKCGQPSRRFLTPPNEEVGLRAENVRALQPLDILPRLKAAATFRDNILTALGSVLLLCLTENTRVPLERIHDAVRTRAVPVYELLPLLPMVKKKIPRQQLYNILQMLERIGNRYVSEYASLCMESLSDGSVPMEKAASIDILTGIDDAIVESIRRDKWRHPETPLTLKEALNFLMQPLSAGTLSPSLDLVAGLIRNIPNFNFNDPEVPDSVRYVAERMEEMSKGQNNTLLEYFAPNQLERADKFVKAILERLEVADLPSETLREAISVLIENFDVPSYPRNPRRKGNLKSVLKITTDYYSEHAVAVADYLDRQLNESDLLNLDIAFFEEGTQAVLQVLVRLQRVPELSYLSKALSLLIPFVSQRLWHESIHDDNVPITFFEVNRYLDSLDTPCLPSNVTQAGKQLRPLLSENLPWTYAFGHRTSSGNPWTMTVNALINLRSTPLTEKQALLMDNYIYQLQSRSLDKQRNSLYDFGIIFQREDSPEVELDLYSLLMRIPNVFREERFAPMLNFFSRPNLFTLLGHEFNKFEYEKPRHLLISLLNKIIALPAVKSDSPLITAMTSARDYLQEPLLVNIYTSEDLQLLLKLLPRVEEDPRYLPLKILFKKQKLFAHLSPAFNLADLSSPMNHLELILNTVNLKPTHKQLSESIRFALNNIEGQPVPPRTYNYDDFVYLVNQLLSHNQTIKEAILNYTGYRDLQSWQISVSGRPEGVLARTLTKPALTVSYDKQLAETVQTAEKILEEEVLIDIPLLKKKTLEAMLEHLPDNAYVKPVNLLLKKANLLMLVPQLNVSSLENSEPREALIALIKSLTQSRNVKAQKILLRRLRSTLRDVEVADKSKPHSSLASYLIQVLGNPNNPMYNSLLTELRNVKNVKISLEDREKVLKNYLNVLKQNGRTEEVRKAATSALEEFTLTLAYNPAQDIDNKKLRQALSLLPSDTVVEPLQKLLTIAWIRGILPMSFKTSDFPEPQQLLKAILFHAKERPDIADNPSLMQGISKVEKILGGWQANVQPLKKIVISVKSAIYDPIKNFLSAASLNKLGITVPTASVSVKTKLLNVLNNLFINPMIKKDKKIMKALGAVIDDVNAFGVNKDLLSVLDDMGVPYSTELVPLRIFLHKDVMGDRYHEVFKYKDRRERFNVLVNRLLSDKEIKKRKKLVNALNITKSSNLGDIETGPIVSDLLDVVHAIPKDVKSKYPDIDGLFNGNVLSRLPDKQQIVDTKNPVITLLVQMSQLPLVMTNITLSNGVVSMYKELEKLPERPVVTGYQLRPLLRELNHVQHINVDFVNEIIDPEVLEYLHAPDFSDVADDQVETLRFIINYVLSRGIADTDEELKVHLNAINRDLQLVMGPSKATKQGVTRKELNALIFLIPRQKAYAPFRIFIQLSDIFRYVRHVRFKKFWKPQEKLMHILKVLETSDLTDDNLKRSIKLLQRYLQERFNFITKEQVKNIYRALIKLRLTYDLAPLKIFFNHDNLIKYLPRDFRYSNYKNSKEALIAVLEKLSSATALQKRTKLQAAIKAAREALKSKNDINKLFRKALTHKTLSAKDLEFIKVLNITSSELKAFLEPPKLLVILPTDFSFASRPTFKSKAMHLLHQLLISKTYMHKELYLLLKDVKFMPDVPDISQAELQSVLDIIPAKGIPNIELLKKYLTVSELRKFLPGTFTIDTENPKQTLRSILLILDTVLGGTKDQKLQVAIDALHSELLNANSKLIPNNSTMTTDELKLLLEEIPFQTYETLKTLEKVLEPSSVIAALPLNFNLTEYSTKKLRVLALLEQLSRGKTLENFREQIRFAEKIIGDMPDAPRINDTDIVSLLDMLPLDGFYLKHIGKSCTVRAIAPYLPINFDINAFESRKKKIVEVTKYCEMSNPADISTKQALDNLKNILKNAPGFDIREDEVRIMINEIPCAPFAKIKTLKLYLAKNEIASSLPWDLDIYSGDVFKTRLMTLVKGLRNVKQFQNNEMFAALSALESSVKNLPEHPSYSENDIERMKKTYPLNDAEGQACASALTWKESLKFMPPTINSFGVNSKVYALLFLTYSRTWPKFRENVEFMKSCEIVKKKLLDEAKKETLKKLRQSSEVNSQIPLKLHLQAWGENFYDSIDHPEWQCRHPWKCYYGYERDIINLNIRVPLKALSSSTWAAKSKALSDAIDAAQNALVNYPTGYYEVEEAINEIPRNEKYDELRLFLGCTDMVDQYLKTFGNYTKDTPPKKMLLNMLYLIKQADIDRELMFLVKAVIEDVQRAVRDWEAEQMFKLLPDYTYHLVKLEPVRSYYILHGPDDIFGIDYATKYPDTRSKLVALHRLLANLPTMKLAGELHDSLEYMGRAMNNHVEVKRNAARSVKDINVKALFVALPKTRNEKIIMGALKFFSDPNILDKIRLAKSPFEYRTKGSLLQAILDKGLETQSVRRDALQQDALEFFRDKVLMAGPGAQPIELKNTAENSNKNVDLLDLLKAIDLSTEDLLKAAGRFTLFIQKDYDNHVYGIGFDQMAYGTRGTYLKAFLQHLLEKSEVPNEVKSQIEFLIPVVQLNGIGEQPVDLYDDNTPDNRMFADEPFPNSVSSLDHSPLTINGSIDPAIPILQTLEAFKSLVQRISPRGSTNPKDRRVLNEIQKIKASLKASIEILLQLPLLENGITASLNISGGINTKTSLNQALKEYAQELEPVKDDDDSYEDYMDDYLDEVYTDEMDMDKDMDKKDLESRMDSAGVSSSVEDSEETNDSFEDEYESDVSFEKARNYRAGESTIKRRTMNPGNGEEKENKNANPSVESATFAPGKILFDHNRRLADANPETATFYPHKVLIDTNFRRSATQSMAKNEPKSGKYVTMKEAEKLSKKTPVRPLTTDDFQLPEPDTTETFLRHEPQRKRLTLNLHSRKLFLRPDASVDIDYGESAGSGSDDTPVERFLNPSRKSPDNFQRRLDRQLANFMSLDNAKNENATNRTVKKDLSKTRFPDSVEESTLTKPIDDDLDAEFRAKVPKIVNEINKKGKTVTRAKKEQSGIKGTGRSKNSGILAKNQKRGKTESSKSKANRPAILTADDLKLPSEKKRGIKEQRKSTNTANVEEFEGQFHPNIDSLEELITS